MIKPLHLHHYMLTACSNNLNSSHDLKSRPSPLSYTIQPWMSHLNQRSKDIFQLVMISKTTCSKQMPLPLQNEACPRITCPHVLSQEPGRNEHCSSSVTLDHDYLFSRHNAKAPAEESGWVYGLSKQVFGVLSQSATSRQSIGGYLPRVLPRNAWIVWNRCSGSAF